LAALAPSVYQYRPHPPAHQPAPGGVV
jgi:hypothetical protein